MALYEEKGQEKNYESKDATLSFFQPFYAGTLFRNSEMDRGRRNCYKSKLFCPFTVL